MKRYISIEIKREKRIEKVLWVIRLGGRSRRERVVRYWRSKGETHLLNMTKNSSTEIEVTWPSLLKSDQDPKLSVAEAPKSRTFKTSLSKVISCQLLVLLRSTLQSKFARGPLNLSRTLPNLSWRAKSLTQRISRTTTILQALATLTSK